MVEKGSMAAAGREVGLAPATVTARLANLEAHFGVSLLRRTTRSLSPTSEGARLLESARRIVDEMSALELGFQGDAAEFVGQVRISAPFDLGRNWLMPLLDRFSAQHPKVQIDLHLSDGYVDLTGKGIDLALRYGRLADSSLKVRKLASVRRVVCAAPSYLERCGTPTNPKQLIEHDCLVMRFGESAERFWPFMVQEREVSVRVRPARTANDGEVVRRWCVSGFGIARKSEADVSRDVKEGRLVPLLTEHELPPIDLQLIFSGDSPPPLRVRAFIDFLVTERESLNLT
jgi:DNA-binding transcriptional LysR family regulator